MIPTDSPRLPSLLLLAACASVVGVSRVAAQQGPPTVALTTPTRTLDEPFSRVSGFRVLSDGRVLVADPTEQTLWKVDPDRGMKEQLGRQGRGPGEYEMPATLFALPGDRTLMMDRLNRRLTLVLPDGELSTSTIPLRLPTGIPVFPRGVDAEGRIYFDLAGMMMPGLEESAATGRAPLLRWDPASDAIDTVGVVHFPPMAGSTRPGEMRIDLGGGGPFQGRDAWAVTADGHVGIARHEDYHVEWLAVGATPVRGPVIAYEPVEITGAEKNAWADAVTTNGMRIEIENGRRRVGRPPRPDIESQDWPETMPPFLDGATFVTPAGHLVVARAVPVAAPRRVYDVFDGSGRLVRQITTPADRRIVGFGEGTVYAVRVDDDDLEWLEIYDL